MEKEEWWSVSVAESRVAERTAPFPEERETKEAEMLSVREAVEEREMRGEEREREEVVDAGVSVMEVSVRCPDVAEKRLVVSLSEVVKEKVMEENVTSPPSMEYTGDVVGLVVSALTVFVTLDNPDAG